MDGSFLADATRRVALAVLLLTAMTLMLLGGVAHARGATIESCDMFGKPKDYFGLNDTIYVTGSGYGSSSFEISNLKIYSVYLVKDVVVWNDRMPIPARVAGTVQKVYPGSSGDISPTPVWVGPLLTGAYDIVVDVNGNGLYDAGIDALDANSITACPVQHYGVLIVPEYWLGSILGMIGCFAAFGVFRLVKRKQ